MNSSLQDNGFILHRNVIGDEDLAQLREECNRLANQSGSACVRRISEQSEVISKLAHSHAHQNLLPNGLQCVRSILFDKTPNDNWPVPWHQDMTIAVRSKIETAGYRPWSVKDGAHHVRPPSTLLQAMISIRIHLDDTPASNGALRVFSGSHTMGIVKQLDTAVTKQFKEVVCTSRAGDVLLMRPLIIHASSRATSPSHRRVIHLEYAPREALHPNLQWLEPLPHNASISR